MTAAAPLALSDAQRSALQVQAHFCETNGSPLSTAVLRACEVLAEQRPGPIAEALRPWNAAGRSDLFAEAVHIRLLGGFHFLALKGSDPTLAAIYAAKAAPPEPQALADALDAAARANPGVIRRFMASPPQTNEVRRCCALLSGFLTIAAETGLPLRTLEIGASAGLNTLWDRHGYDFGAFRWGDRCAAVQLDAAWSGPPPPLPLPTAHVAERAACDQAPVDVTDEDEALRLQAFVWAGQDARLARLRAAIELARAEGVRVDRADAADWLATYAEPRPGMASVVHHSVMWQYMPAQTQAACRAILKRAGAQATPGAPFAWLRMETADPPAEDMQVRLTLWPGGEDRLLAWTHPHGASVRWIAAD